MANVRKAADSRVDKPWGYELRWAVTDRYLGKVLHVNRGEALSLQYHERKDEWILLAKGVLDLELDGVVHRLEGGDAVRITPGTRHRMTAVEDCDIFEVSTPEIDDVVRLEDRYGRVAPKPNPARGQA
jgi:mannose-6-phosphate isomerase-like protein (cupin superfamily)